jgi:hypothetical protein
MENISPHITYLEATRTSKPFANVPNAKQRKAMKLVAERVFEPLREHIDAPITIDSFFRSVAVNEAVGGVDTSQHLKGEAIDMKGSGKITNLMLFDWIKDNLTYDQLIWEFGGKWIHVSYSATRNRMQVIYT